MLTISKPLSATQATAYHVEEFTSAQQSYYTEGRIRGEWRGRLAAEWGLEGEVGEEAFARLAAGRHPETGEQLIRYQAPREIVDDSGAKSRTLEHRAGWDATFSAPKTVSLTALAGGDERVRQAHREAVERALDELERYVEARIGGNAPAETTGKWIAARFEHDSARPVDGYAAPQLHTHAVFFNLTETEDGKARALQPHELYRTQRYATAVYQSELAWKLRELGYETEPGVNGAPEIRGYTREYVEAMSPRSRQIRERLAREGRGGAEAAEIAAHRTREAKQTIGPEETQRRHRETAAAYGNQPARVVQAARQREQALDGLEAQSPIGRRPVQSALTFARDKNLEREAVTDERALLADALQRAQGRARLDDVREGFERRIEQGDFIEVEARIGRAFTTPEMLRLEEENIAIMQAGRERHEPLVAEVERFERLSESQQRAVETVLASRDRISGLEGAAGAGKTTSLAAVREAAEREGYRVEGFAPTSRAAQQLSGAGIEASTLQRHLARGGEPEGAGGKRLWVVDESSLASTKQMHEFFDKLGKDDRVLLVGDTRQHQGVDAGRPFEQLQQAGMRTARLDEIVRQKDPALKEAVEYLAQGRVREAVAKLDAEGRIEEIPERDERLRAIARDYAERPEGALVVSPDNRSRRELNEAIRNERRERGQLQGDEHRARVLLPRQELTGADRAWAARYETGDVVRYSKGSRAMGLAAGEYARVESVDAERNRLTVERANGEHVRYDPRRLQGVTVYRESERGFQAGDRVQFTAPDRERRIANRELGTIERIDERGVARVKLDAGGRTRVPLDRRAHLDHGYAVTSHSSQGSTADRVLIHVDSEGTGAKLVNSRLAYVAVSRARYEARIYTNDKSALGKALSREVSHSAALSEPRATREQSPVQPAPAQSRAQGLALEL